VQRTRTGRPRGADDVRDREAIARVVDRRREELAQRQATESLVELAPTVDGARHADRERAALGDYAEIRAREMLARQR